MTVSTLVFVLVALVAPCLGRDLFGQRVVGGQQAVVGQFPHMVSLRDKYNGHACGGSIITPRTILTAAHCVVGVKAEEMTVATGSVTLDGGEVQYKTSRLIVHPDFDDFTARTDIGLIILEEDIVFNNRTQPIEVASEVVGVGLNVTLSGWGTTSYPGILPNNLQYIVLKTISFEECESSYENINPVFEDDNLCTSNGVGQGLCNYDSGSPGILNNKVVGVVSWGFVCALGYPDVFARVSSFSQWINANKV